MREEQPFGLGSEGNIRYEHKMDILGNTKQLLYTEKTFLLIYYHRAFELLPGVFERF